MDRLKNLTKKLAEGSAQNNDIYDYTLGDGETKETVYVLKSDDLQLMDYELQANPEISYTFAPFWTNFTRNVETTSRLGFYFKLFFLTFLNSRI